MEAITWGGVLHFGTFNATRLAMEVVNANLDVLTRNGNSGITHLFDVGDKIIAGYNEIFNHRKIPAIVHGFGPMFQIYFTEKEEVLDFRDYCGHVDLEKYKKENSCRVAWPD